MKSERIRQRGQCRGRGPAIDRALAYADDERAVMGTTDDRAPGTRPDTDGNPHQASVPSAGQRASLSPGPELRLMVYPVLIGGGLHDARAGDGPC